MTQISDRFNRWYDVRYPLETNQLCSSLIYMATAPIQVEDQEFEPPDELRFWHLENQPKWSKRLRKLFYQRDLNVNDGFVERTSDTIGNYCQYVSDSLVFEWRQTIDWNDGDFGDGNSCFWGGNSEHRHALSQDDRCGAVLIHEVDSETGGNIPLARCLFFEYDDDVILFNAYSRRSRDGSVLNLYDIANGIAVYYDWEMAIINVESNIWINSGIGIRIGPDVPQETVARLHVDIEESVRCGDCDQFFPESDLVDVDTFRMVCPDCLDHYQHCDDCQVLRHYSDVARVTVEDRSVMLCNECANYYAYCNGCNQYRTERNQLVSIGDAIAGDMCSHCAADKRQVAQSLVQYVNRIKSTIDTATRHVMRQTEVFYQNSYSPGYGQEDMDQSMAMIGHAIWQASRDVNAVVRDISWHNQPQLTAARQLLDERAGPYRENPAKAVGLYGWIGDHVMRLYAAAICENGMFQQAAEHADEQLRDYCRQYIHTEIQPRFDAIAVKIIADTVESIGQDRWILTNPALYVKAVWSNSNRGYYFEIYDRVQGEIGHLHSNREPTGAVRFLSTHMVRDYCQVDDVRQIRR